MDNLTIVSLHAIRQAIYGWTDLVIFMAATVGGMYITDHARRVLYQAGLDFIALYSAWHQARQDTAMRQLEVSRARLLIEEQRHRLLDGLQ